MKTIIKKIVLWLLRYVPEWILVREDAWLAVNRENSEIREQAQQLLGMVEPLTVELEQTRAAYDALLEEMEELLHG